jgi:ABC-type lipoprotein export system ATPase subunit
MLKTESLTFSYDNSQELSFPDIELERGENLLVLGKSGAGKTTFIQILAGLLKPKKGQITLDGNNYQSLSESEMDQFRGSNVGMVFQTPHFVNNISVMDNLLLSLHLSKMGQDKKKIIKLLHKVGLGEKTKVKPSELSQGEKQRASIALAVIKNPKLILADEPTSSLDDENCSKICSLLKVQAEATNAHLILVTHDQRVKSEFSKSIML